MPKKQFVVFYNANGDAHAVSVDKADSWEKQNKGWRRYNTTFDKESLQAAKPMLSKDNIKKAYQEEDENARRAQKTAQPSTPKPTPATTKPTAQPAQRSQPSAFMQTVRDMSSPEYWQKQAEEKLEREREADRQKYANQQQPSMGGYIPSSWGPTNQREIAQQKRLQTAEQLQGEEGKKKEQQRINEEERQRQEYDRQVREYEKKNGPQYTGPTKGAAKNMQGIGSSDQPLAGSSIGALASRSNDIAYQLASPEKRKEMDRDRELKELGANVDSQNIMKGTTIKVIDDIGAQLDDEIKKMNTLEKDDGKGFWERVFDPGEERPYAMSYFPSQTHMREESRKEGPGGYWDKILEGSGDDRHIKEDIANAVYNSLLEQDESGNPIMDENGNVIVKQDVIDAAERAGKSVDRFINENYMPQMGQALEDAIQKRVGKKLEVKGAGDYIMRAIENSVTGKIMQMAFYDPQYRMSRSEEFAKARGEWRDPRLGESVTAADQGTGYKAGGATKAVGEVSAFVADAGLMAATGGTATKLVATPVLNFVGRKTAGTMFGRVLGGNALATADAALGKQMAANITRGMISSGASLGNFMGTSSAVDEIYTNPEASWGSVLSAYGKGFMHGAKAGTFLGAMGGSLGTIGGKYLGAEAGANFWNKAGNLMIKKTWTAGEWSAEAGVFIAMDALTQGKDFNLAESMESSFRMVFAGKMSGMVTGVATGGRERMGQMLSHLFDPYRHDAWDTMRLSKSEKNILYKEYGKDFWDLGNSKERNEKIKDKAQRQKIADTLKNAMENPMVPWVTKAKIAMSAGIAVIKRPYTRTWTDDPTGKKLSTWSEKGELIDVREYKDTNERDAIIEEEKERKTLEEYNDLFALYTNMLASKFYTEHGFDPKKGQDDPANKKILEDPKLREQLNEYIYNPEHLAFRNKLMEDYGIRDEEELQAILYKDPMRMNEVEKGVILAYKEWLANATIGNAPAIRRSAVDGMNAVQDARSMEQKSAVIATAQNAYNEAKARLEAWLNEDQDRAELFNKLSNENKSPIEIWDEFIQSGFTEEQMAPFKEYVDALGKLKGAQDQFEREHKAKLESARNVRSKGTVNGEKVQDGDVVVIEDEEGNRCVVTQGDINIDADGNVTISKEGSGLVLLQFPDGAGTMKAGDKFKFVYQDSVDLWVNDVDKFISDREQESASQQQGQGAMPPQGEGGTPPESGTPQVQGEGTTPPESGTPPEGGTPPEPPQGSQPPQNPPAEPPATPDGIPLGGKSGKTKLYHKVSIDKAIEDIKKEGERTPQQVAQMRINSANNELERIRQENKEGVKRREELENNPDAKTEEEYEDLKSVENGEKPANGTAVGELAWAEREQNEILDYYQKLKEEAVRQEREENSGYKVGNTFKIKVGDEIMDVTVIGFDDGGKIIVDYAGEGTAGFTKEQLNEYRKAAEGNNPPAEGEGGTPPADQVPDWVADKPADARARGYRMVEGQRVDRQEPVEGVEGNEVSVKFSNNESDKVQGRVTVMDAGKLQPSHIEGKRNPLFFVDEGQPKDRTGSVSDNASEKIASDINPEEITGSVTAYTGAPCVNARGEVIQGNNRTDALKKMWERYPEQAEKYKQWLIDNAERFGLDPEEIRKMEQPVLVNRLDVTDEEFIRLGQFTAQDTESGGVERIKPAQTANKLGEDLQTFANRLLSSEDEDMSISELLDKNGVETLKWLNRKGIISDTQYASAFDAKGNLTGEAKNDLKGILIQTIFKGTGSNFEGLFAKLPAKAQKAILATAHRDISSPEGERIAEHIQQAVIAFSELMSDEGFAGAKTYEEAKRRVAEWLAQTGFGFEGEQTNNIGKYSDFVLELATMFKGKTQKYMQGVFNKLYDLVQGNKDKEGSLFEEETAPKSLSDAVRELLNVKLEKNGQHDKEPVEGGGESGTGGRPGGTGADSDGRPAEEGTGETGPRRGTGAGVGQKDKLLHIDEIEGLKNAPRSAIGTIEEFAVQAYNDALVRINPFQFGIPEEQQERMTYEKFAERFREYSGNFLFKGCEPYLKEVYEHLKKRVEEEVKKQQEKRNKSQQKGPGNAMAAVEKAAEKHQKEQDEKNGVKRDKKAEEEAAKKRAILESDKPLTVEEIDNSDYDNAAKVCAKAYLNGDKSQLNEISYIAIYQDVRNTQRSSERDSADADGAQLAGTGDSGVGGSGRDGGATEPTGDGNEPGVHSDENGQGDRGTVAGTQGDSGMAPTAPGVETVPPAGGESGGGNGGGIDGTERGQSAGEGGGGAPAQATGEQPAGDAGERGVTISPATYTNKKGETLDLHLVKSDKPLSREEKKELNKLAKEDKGWYSKEDGGYLMRTKEGAEKLAEAMRQKPEEKPLTREEQIKAYDDDLDALETEFRALGNQARRLNYNVPVDLAPVWAKQTAILLKMGYITMKKGALRFADWLDNMKKRTTEMLKDVIGWDDKDIDEFIRDMWEAPYEMDGRTLKLREWADEMGHEQLRKEVARTFDEKREAQQKAEDIEVEIGNKDNIDATLPYLLPEQRDDVLKAEQQFFGEDRKNSREHANGKGMLFTNGTGTGKTYTGLGVIKRFAKQGKKRILIIVPSQTKVSDWIKDGYNLGLGIKSLDEVAKDEGGKATATKVKGDGIVITTYANMRANRKILEDTFDLVVYDECQHIMENKNGEETLGTGIHYALTNKSLNHTERRLQMSHPLWIKAEDLQREYAWTNKTIEAGVISERQGKNTVNRPITEQEKASLAARKIEIENELREIHEEQQKIIPEIRQRAEAEWEKAKDTKVLFLSATPFNQRKSLRYAEGYLFRYPEENQSTIGSYGHISPEAEFYLKWFPAGYTFRYNELQESITNQGALSRQEVAFAEHLKKMGVMSGRVLDNGFDYSRTFPTLTFDMADRFNDSLNSLWREEKYAPLRKVVGAVFYNYERQQVMFEAMKTSLAIPRIKEYLAAGKKVVVFHRRKSTKADVQHPFAQVIEEARKEAMKEKNPSARNAILNAIEHFKIDFADMLAWEKTINYDLPREQLIKEFGEERVGLFSGTDTQKNRMKDRDDFNSDDGEKDIMIVQEASGKEGIDLHDKTSKYPRVLISLSLPQSPITFIQMEGRINRYGQKSNAAFEFPLLGLDLEEELWGGKFNSVVGTTENLSLGEGARNLRESLMHGVQFDSDVRPVDQLGVGGKSQDGLMGEAISNTDGFEKAVEDYSSERKKNGARDAREGKDYYPTPEPVGYMMVQMAHIQEGESVLEPSAGHGAIARYVSPDNRLTMIEPSGSLRARLTITTGRPGESIKGIVFEDYSQQNKHEVILMNPPFGVGGKTAMDHVAKAFDHLREGGRIVALVPRGQMDKRMEKWLEQHDNAVVSAEVNLPGVAFEKAGTKVNTRIVVIDKVTNPEMRSKMEMKREYDLTHCTDINDLFDAIRNVEVPDRTIDKVELARRKAEPAEKALQSNPMIDERYTELRVDDDGTVSLYPSIKYRNTKGYNPIVYRISNKMTPESALSVYNGLMKALRDAEKNPTLEQTVKRTGDKEGHMLREEAVKLYRDQLDLLYRLTGKTQGEYNQMAREKAERDNAVIKDAIKYFTYNQVDERYWGGQRTVHEVRMEMPINLPYETRNLLIERAEELGGNEYYRNTFRFDSEEDAKAFLDTERKTLFSHAPTTERRAEPGITEHVEKVSKKLNVPVRIATRLQDVTNPEARKEIMEGRQPDGWYESDGSITLYLPNIHSRYRAEQVLMHEAVGHKGLRGLLGEAGYKDLMRKIWYDKDNKKMMDYVNANFWRNNANLWLTIDEYLAEEAESLAPNNVFSKIRNWLGVRLTAMGFRFVPSVRDVRYLLWLSKNGLKKGNAWVDVKRARLQKKLGIEEARIVGRRSTLFSTSKDLYDRFGSRWIDEQTQSDGRHSSQIDKTLSSYQKFGEWVKKDSEGKKVSILDASSGLGLGTQWMRQNGFEVDDVEPYPSKDREAPTFLSYDDIDKKYDYIISNAVLNVIPDDWRADVLHNMADKLNVGGKLLINVRSASDIAKQGKEGKSRITLDNPSEILVLRPNKSVRAYQKGFTKNELKEWCEKELGDGYTVEIANEKTAGDKYETAVVVTKKSEGKTLFSHAKEDTAYMDAVKKGDDKTAERMVREAAKRAMPDTKVVDKDGNPLVVYHGSPVKDITTFDKERIGEHTNAYSDGAIYATDSEDVADVFSHEMLQGSTSFTTKLGEKGKTYPLYMDMKNPFDFRQVENSEEMQSILKSMPEIGNGEFYDSVIRALKYGNHQLAKRFIDFDKLKELGYDGVIARMYSYDEGKGDALEYGVFDPEQIKSADPVTRDDNGNVIPLSERFNQEKKDIRFSHANGDKEDKKPIFFSHAKSTARSEHDSMRRKHLDEVARTVSSHYGLKSSSILETIYDEEDMESLRNYVDDDTWNTIYESFIHPTATGLLLNKQNMVIVFTGKIENDFDVDLTYFHEHTHKIFNELPMSEEEKLRAGMEVLSYLKEKAPESYDIIIRDYDKSVHHKEAVAFFVEYIINNYGAERFLEDSFEGNEIIANLATEIQKAFVYGKEKESNQFGHTVRRFSTGDKSESGVSSEETNHALRRGRERREGDTTFANDRDGGRNTNLNVAHAAVAQPPQADSFSAGGSDAPRTLFSHAPGSSAPVSMGDYQRMVYEDKLKKASFAWDEAHHDYMASFKHLQNALANGKELMASRDAYIAENHMSSKVAAKDEVYVRRIWRPLVEVFNKVVDAMPGGKWQDRAEQAEQYAYMKSGLERNRVFAVRDFLKEKRESKQLPSNAVATLLNKMEVEKHNALEEHKRGAITEAEMRKREAKAEEDYRKGIEMLRLTTRRNNEMDAERLENDWNALRSDLRDKLDRGVINLREYFEQLDEWIRNEFDPKWEVQDMSGLNNFTDGTYDDEEIINRVMDSEAAMGADVVNEFWNGIKTATTFTLDNEYACGMINKGTRDRVRDMMDWYIPMRGFKEETAEEVYDYLEDRYPVNSPGNVLKGADGRTTLADSPLATIGAMAHNSISRGEKNMVKQKFLNLVRDTYDTQDSRRLVSISRIWEEHIGVDPTTGEEIWEPVWCDTNGMTPDQASAAIDQFNQDMEQKKANGEARVLSNRRAAIDYINKHNPNIHEHVIEVSVAGEHYLLYVNGNPRAAQAINGQLSPGRSGKSGAEKALRATSRFMRGMAGRFTSYSPSFVLSNTSRDAIFSRTNIATKENGRYLANYIANYHMVGALFTTTKIWRRWKEGTLDMGNPIHRYFKEWMDNGGKTGYIADFNIDKYKDELMKGVKRHSTKGHMLLKPFKLVLDGIEGLNMRAENIARFATYVTSRRMGRGIQRSVNDAKEVSVNFNRRGAGSKAAGKTLNSKFAGYTAGYMRHAYLFYNAGVQSMALIAKNAKQHPTKFALFNMAAFMAAGYFMSQINSLIGEESEKMYCQLSDWERRNNMCICIPKMGTIKIPLPIELRAFYGMGDIFAAKTVEPRLKTTEPTWKELMMQITQAMPLDVLGEGGSFTASIVPDVAKPVVQNISNRSWTGAPLQKETQWNKNDPQWTKAFSSTSGLYVDFSKWLNNVTNGPDDADIKNSSSWDISPAKLQNLVRGYGGGTYTTIMEIADMLGHAFGVVDGEISPRNVPMLKALYIPDDEKARYGRSEAKYWKYVEKDKVYSDNFKKYKNKATPEAYGRMEQMERSADGKRHILLSEYQQEVNELNKQVSAIERYIANETDKEAREAAKNELKTLKEHIKQRSFEIVEQLDAIE